MLNGTYNAEQIKAMVESQINSSSLLKEGTNYDFKADWWASEEEQCKDILAMLNVIQNDNDCFIIVGLKENKNSNRDVIGYELFSFTAKQDNYFNNFANTFNVKPDLHIHNVDICYNKKDLHPCQIVSIENRYGRPYFLKNVNKYSSEPKGLEKVKYYTRHDSSSKPATTDDIERLYRYKFRLDKTPWEKFYWFLDISNILNWESVEKYSALPAESFHSIVRTELYSNQDPSYRIIGPLFDGKIIINYGKPSMGLISLSHNQGLILEFETEQIFYQIPGSQGATLMYKPIVDRHNFMTIKSTILLNILSSFSLAQHFNVMVKNKQQDLMPLLNFILSA